MENLDPPYDEASTPLYKDLGIFAARVLRDGGSLVVITGHGVLLKCANYIEGGFVCISYSRQREEDDILQDVNNPPTTFSKIL